MKKRRESKPSVLPYMHMAEVCKLFGYSPSRTGQYLMRRRICDRVDNSRGRLDKWDPRRHGKKDKRGVKFYVTMITLKMLFPERFDRPSEMIQHLERRLREFDKRFESLEEQLAIEKKNSRQRDGLLKDAIEQLSKQLEEVSRRRASAA